MMTPNSIAPTADAPPTYVEKRKVLKGGAAPLFRVELLVLASVVLGAAGQLSLKASLLLLPGHGPSARLLGFPIEVAAGVAAGLGIYAIGTWFWIRAVSRAAISYLYPLSACSYAVVALGGHLLFGEVMPAWRWAGIAVMSAGVALLAASGDRGAA